jgi:predicted nucleotidyltransferase
MGRIFSYEDISAGLVPTPGDFNVAATVFLEESELAIQEGLVDGAFVYGSVALGVAGTRSDFDALVSMTNRPEAYDAVATIIDSIREATNETIPTSPIVQRRRALEHGRHEMDRFFGKHLASTERLIVGNDPAEYIRFSPRSAADIFSDYVFHKKRTLSTARTSGSYLDTTEGNGIQRMLELPPAIGRKALQALAEVGHTDQTVERTADKAEVKRQAGAIMADLGIEEDYKQLIETDNQYSALLQEALKGNVTRDDYEDALRDLHSRIPSAIGWLEQVELFVIPRLRLAKI